MIITCPECYTSQDVSNAKPGIINRRVCPICGLNMKFIVKEETGTFEFMKDEK